MKKLESKTTKIKYEAAPKAAPTLSLFNGKLSIADPLYKKLEFISHEEEGDHAAKYFRRTLKYAEQMAFHCKLAQRQLHRGKVAEAINSQRRADTTLDQLIFYLVKLRDLADKADKENANAENAPTAADNSGAIGGSGASVDQPPQPVSPSAGVGSSGAALGGDVVNAEGDLPLYGSNPSSECAGCAPVGDAVAWEVKSDDHPAAPSA